MILAKLFLILVPSLLVYWFIPKQALRTLVLIAFSFLFILIIDKWSLAVVLGLSIFSYAFGILIDRYPNRKYIHTIGVCGVLAALIVFKYLGFLTGTLNSLTSFIHTLPRFEIQSILLPIGISYIVFKHISYLTDIRWGIVKPGRFTDFLLYSSLFTIFVAGPIERFERFKPQVEQKRIEFAWSNVEYGFKRIVFGLLKKVVFADWLGYWINPVWINPPGYDHWAIVLALLGYAFQIYFDFAGYSDIAIGSSKLFGFTIMENFNYPYLAPNISQFWRRWHISLSDWIRDYLFFPLSGISSAGIWRLICVPVIAMSICGLWHCPAWHFVLWGAWHGVGLSILQIWNNYVRKSKKLKLVTKSRWFGFVGTFVTFGYVALGWIAIIVYGSKLIISMMQFDSIALLTGILIPVVAIMLMSKKYITYLADTRIIVIYTLLSVICLACLKNTGFIYAQF